MKQFLFVGLSFFLNFSAAWGNSHMLPRSLKEIKRFLDLQPIQNDFVPGGKVVWARYDRLRRDFDFLQSKTDAEIDQWIVQNFSVISSLQSQLTDVRVEDYPRKPTDMITYREPTDGRADTVVIKDDNGQPQGLISRKGVGISQLKLDRNREILKVYQERDGLSVEEAIMKLRGLLNTNGVELMGEAIREVAVMESLQMLYDIINSEVPSSEARLESVESYFLLQLPIKAYRGNGLSPAPVTVYGRQANYGRIWSNHFPWRQRINLKQIDFTGSAVDGGTVKLDSKDMATAQILLDEFYKIKGLTVGEQIVTDLDHNPRAVYNFIDKIVAPLKERWEEAHKKLLPPPKTTVTQRIDSLMKMLLEDPIHRASLSVVLLAAQSKGNEPVLSLASSQEAIKTLLQVDASMIDESYPHVVSLKGKPNDFPVIRWGLLLLPSLVDQEFAKKTAIEILSAHPRYARYLIEALDELPKIQRQRMVDILFVIPSPEVKSLLMSIKADRFKTFETRPVRVSKTKAPMRLKLK